MDGEPELVEANNSLGNSRADNIKYKQFDKERLLGVPILENLIEIDPSNVEALTTLKNIFGTIGDSIKFKKTKEKLEALGQ